jgi:hypothetical protein
MVGSSRSLTPTIGKELAGMESVLQKPVEEALWLDCRGSTSDWLIGRRDLFQDDDLMPVGYKAIACQDRFDIKTLLSQIA